MRVPAVALGCGLALAAANESSLRRPAAAAAATGGLTEHNPPPRPAFVTARERPQQQRQQRRKRRLPTGHRCGGARKPLAAGSKVSHIPCFVAPLGRCGVGCKEMSTKLQRHPRRPEGRLLAMVMNGSGDQDEDERNGSGAETGAAGGPRKGGAPMPRMVSWGLNSRSQPNARKALGSSSKTHTIVYVCEVCGSEHVQWVGRCPTCKEWNCVKPFKVRREQGSSPSRVSRATAARVSAGVPPAARGGGGDLEFSGLGGGAFGGSGGAGWLPEEGFAAPVRLSEVGKTEKQERMPLPGSELPRVLGGGLVPGSMVMLGGDPGVGKSTLLLQLAGRLATSQAGDSFSASAFEDEIVKEDLQEGATADPEDNHEQDGEQDDDRFRAGTVVYISGEENNSQVAARAARMGIKGVDLFLYCETDIDVIIDQMLVLQPQPALVMVDSIQTMRTQDSTSSPGSVTQVKECASRLVRLAKGSGITVFIVGHVTKSGSIAGPKVVEHMVDTVLYLEGDRFNSYRLLRSVKNRFGPSNEIGVFEMEAGGLDDVADPSMLFLSTKHVDGDGGDEHEKNMDGSAVCVYMEGSRPILCELQSLVTYSRLPSPRRTSDGLPVPRLLLLLAVLQKRLGYDMGSREVYLNIVGGLRVQETAADLAVALAVVSSYTTVPVRSDTCFIGEIGLGGELRPVQQLSRRIQEAETFGFSRVVVPFTRKNRSAAPRGGRGRGSGKGTGRSEAASSTRKGMAVSTAAETGDVGRRGTIQVLECRNLKDAVAAGLTSVPKVRKRSYKAGDGSSAAARGGRGGGRGGGPYEPLHPTPPSEPEFGWQQQQSLRHRPVYGEGDGDGYGDALGREQFVSGFHDGSSVDIEGFEGGWGAGQEDEQERHGSDTEDRGEEADP